MTQIGDILRSNGGKGPRTARVISISEESVTIEHWLKTPTQKVRAEFSLDYWYSPVNGWQAPKET